MLDKNPGQGQTLLNPYKKLSIEKTVKTKNYKKKS